MLFNLRALSPFHNSANQSKDWLGLILIIGSSLLIGIWAVKGTIALRNILLFICSILSVIYCYRFFKFNTQIIPFRYWAPLALIGLLFCWVLIHFFMYSVYPDQQWKELNSTWLRAFLGAIVAFGTSISLLKNKHFDYLLTGIAAPFVVIGVQYTQLVWKTGGIFQPNVGQYIFVGKINAVLTGSFLITILLVYLFENYFLKKNKKLNLKIATSLVLFFLIQYCYVFIFDTRNGVAIASLQLIFCILIFLPTILRNSCSQSTFFGITLILSSFLCLGASQFKYNHGWPHFLEDILISSQVEENRQWINPQKYGYPYAGPFRIVAHNTYERVSWFVVGSKFLKEHPFGNGVLHATFGKNIEMKYPEISSEISSPQSTHSALLDYGLSYGWPFLVLIFLIFMTLLLNAKSSTTISPYYIYQALFGLFMVYFFGELGSGHGVEIFIFVLIFLSGLELTPKKP